MDDQTGLKKFGRLDVLINNAGFGASGAFEEISDEELRNLIETNYFGVTNVMREVIPIMRQQKSGMILTVSSQAGAMGFLGSSAYCSSKYAVVGLSEALRMELAPFGTLSHCTGKRCGCLRQPPEALHRGTGESESPASLCV